VSTFEATSYQNEFLADGATEVNAIVTVKATTGAGGPVDAGAASAGGHNEMAEVIMIDTSGSMGQPSAKIRAARTATCTALDCLADGTWFGVIGGAHTASLIYPTSGTNLVRVTGETRAAAKQAVERLTPVGGTAISTWLSLANKLFAQHPGAIKHAILLTDGRNESEPEERLDQVVRECEGQFQCDCRGVGANWVVSELRDISTALLGTVDIIPQPDLIDDDFRAMTERAMGKAVSSVALRVWTPKGARLRFVKQVAPRIEDLSARATVVNPLTADYPTGAWGDEERDYHICIEVPPNPVGAEMLAARVSIVVDGEVTSQSLVKANWTNDHELSTQINDEVAHYTGQAELADAIQAGLAARKAGDEQTATVKLGRAAQLAAETGNDATTRLLAKVVDIDDAVTGTVRLKRNVEDVDEMALDTRSTKTVRVNK
jgi:hypothetical protein